MPARRDEGLTTAVASLILFALAFLIFASAFAWVGRAAEMPPETPRAMVLAGETGVQTTPSGETKAWSIAAVSHGTPYDEILWRLDGEPLPCTSAWGTTDGWRVWSSGVLIECAGNAPIDLIIQPGDIIEIFDAGARRAGAPGLRGADFQAVDVPARALMFTLPVA